jgi:hypothetical protein
LTGRRSIILLFVFIFTEEEVVGANTGTEPAPTPVYPAVITEVLVANRTLPELLFLVGYLALEAVQSLAPPTSTD